MNNLELLFKDNQELAINISIANKLNINDIINLWFKNPEKKTIEFANSSEIEVHSIWKFEEFKIHQVITYLKEYDDEYDDDYQWVYIGFSMYYFNGIASSFDFPYTNTDSDPDIVDTWIKNYLEVILENIKILLNERNLTTCQIL